MSHCWPCINNYDVDRTSYCLFVTSNSSQIYSLIDVDVQKLSISLTTDIFPHRDYYCYYNILDMIPFRKRHECKLFVCTGASRILLVLGNALKPQAGLMHVNKTVECGCASALLLQLHLQGSTVHGCSSFHFSYMVMDGQKLTPSFKHKHMHTLFESCKTVCFGKT